MKHIPFLHEYKAIAVKHFYDTSYGDRTSSTIVTSLCSCGKLKTISLYGSGFLELKDF